MLLTFSHLCHEYLGIYSNSIETISTWINRKRGHFSKMHFCFSFIICQNFKTKVYFQLDFPDVGIRSQQKSLVNSITL